MRKISFSCLGGYSLIEILISISIVAILIINAPPSYINWYQQTKLKNAVSEVTLLLHQAQRIAVTDNQPAFVAFSGTTPPGIIMTTFFECVSNNICPPQHVGKQLLISDPVALESINFPQSYIRFAPSTGLADGMAGSLIMRTSHFRIKLIVSRLGRIRTCAMSRDISGIPLC